MKDKPLAFESEREFGTSVSTDFILGMGKVGKKVIMLLDIDKVLSSGEIAVVPNAVKIS